MFPHKCFETNMTFDMQIYGKKDILKQDRTFLIKKYTKSRDETHSI